MSAPAFPDSVAVVGGGRWARVLLETLASLLPQSTALSASSYAHGAELGAWLKEKGLAERVSVRARLPDADAVLVANRAADHETAAIAALEGGAFVLLEKPLAPEPAAAERILARAGGRLAASQVFRWSRGVELLARRCAEAGGALSLSVAWTDAAAAVRHGEPVRHDESISFPADVLPHVCALSEAVLGRPPRRLVSAAAQGGVQRLALDAEGLAVDARLERRGLARKRVVEARAGRGVLTLDFSAEPGTVSGEGFSESADPLWDRQPRPVASMVAAFLSWAAGGPKDPRLEPGTPLLACRLAAEAAKRLA